MFPHHSDQVSQSSQVSRTVYSKLSQLSQLSKIIKNCKNIARGTTDPEIDSVTWIELGKNMAPLTLVANLTTRWRHLHKSTSLALPHCLELPS